MGASRVKQVEVHPTKSSLGFYEKIGFLLVGKDSQECEEEMVIVIKKIREKLTP